MLYYAITGGALGLIGFCLLSPRVKVLIAFFVMTLCFDLVPRILFKVDVWDIGAILLFIAWLQLTLVKRDTATPVIGYVVIMRVLLGWMVLCLLWSVVINEYPIVNTLKASRQMIIGVFSFFVFRKLYMVDEGAYSFFMRTLYVATFVLLLVCLVQFVLHRPLLFGLYREYGDVTRSLPVFLPLSLLYLWVILSKCVTAFRVRAHEFVYMGIAIAVTILTFTRGIYISVLFVFGLMLLLLVLEKMPSVMRLSYVAVSLLVFLSTLCVTAFYFTEYGEKVAERFSSAVSLIFAQKTQTDAHNQDTFTGRMGIAKERFEMVLENNPVVGYGFLHEGNVPGALRAKLKYGSVISTPEYLERYKAGYPYVLAFHSADIGWADVMINTGLVGVALWLLLLASLIVNFHVTAGFTQPDWYHARLAHLLQIVVGMLLMFESNTFVSLVQIPAFILAGYWYCGKGQSELQPNRVPVASMKMASV